jgi:hypothetical protein
LLSMDTATVHLQVLKPQLSCSLFVLICVYSCSDSVLARRVTESCTQIWMTKYAVYVYTTILCDWGCASGYSNLWHSLGRVTVCCTQSTILSVLVTGAVYDAAPEVVTLLCVLRKNLHLEGSHALAAISHQLLC